MRTRKQLGYIVFMRATEFEDTVGLQFVIQSSNHSCNYIMDQLDKFIDYIKPKVLNLSEQEFETLKGGMTVNMI